MLLVGVAVGLLGAAAVLQRRSGRERSRPAPGPLAAPAAAAAPAGGSHIVELLATHHWARRGLGAAAVALLLGAVAAAGYPFLTDRYTDTLQTRLERELVQGSTRAAYVASRVPVGASLTRIKSPAMGLDTVVVQGVTASALRAGAGHYPETPLPCEQGNVAIAGHRTTFGKPFADLEKLVVGDEITLETPIGSCTYAVSVPPFEVDPREVEVVAPTGDAQLTLTTCHPEGSARQRLVVHAELVADDQDQPT